MKRCRAWRKRIPEALYGELDLKTREKLDRHLAACERCSDLYLRMAETVRKVSIRPAPDREAEFWEGYWDSLERRMAHEKAKEERAEPAGMALKARRAAGVPRWAYGAAGAAILLAIGIFIGRTFFPQPAELARSTPTIPTVTPPVSQPEATTAAVEPPLAVRASRYLKRSRVLILAVVNYDPRAENLYGLNLPLQKKTSDELVKEAAILKKELRSSDRRLERLVSDLEMILLQIANLKSESDVSAVEIIKSGVESKDILFKINLSEVRRLTGKAGTGQAPDRSGADSKGQNVKTAP
jgi:anti-sigma factor RsiW